MCELHSYKTAKENRMLPAVE